MRLKEACREIFFYFIICRNNVLLHVASFHIFMFQDADLGACAPRKSGVELESLITSVHDLLPDLGEGFIEVCLEEYNYDVERVINAVLEDKLLPSLQDLDRNMPRYGFKCSFV